MNEMSKKYYQTFVVETVFNFPIDMLRYDGCFPHSEMDAGKIDRSLTLQGHNPVEVKIGRYVSTKHDQPTVERWMSFGCKISEVEIK